MMSDSRPIVVTIDANAAIDSNRYAESRAQIGPTSSQRSLRPQAVLMSPLRARGKSVLQAYRGRNYRRKSKSVWNAPLTGARASHRIRRAAEAGAVRPNCHL